MLPDRPDIEEYTQYTDDLADAKDNLARLEYALDKKVAVCIRDAMAKGAKTRALDYIKVLGNSEADTKEMEELREKILDLKKVVSILYGKIKAWDAGKDLYRTDAFYDVRGRQGYETSDERKEED